MAAPPRDSLPTVERFYQFSLLGMLASGSLALAGSGPLDWVTQFALLAALIARAARISGWFSVNLSSRTIALVALAGLCFFPLDGWLVSGSAPVATLHLFVILVTLKLLTASTNLDNLYLQSIAVTELVAAAMLAVNLEFFVFLALFLLFAVAALASGEVRRSVGVPGMLAHAGQRGFGRRLGLTSFVLCGGILTMTAGLFFVLPRAARGALSRFMPNRPGLQGFADKVTLGDIGRIQQSSRTVMRARADNGESLERVRWRGGALSRFDGKTWDNPNIASEQLVVGSDGSRILNTAPQRRPGRQIEYQVHMDEIATDTLFFAGEPETIRISVPLIWRSAGGAFHVKGAPSGLIYHAYSFVEDERAPALFPPGRMDPSEREDLIRLPDNTDPRIGMLARKMSAGADSDDAKARAIEYRLQHDYSYTLELPAVPPRDPVAYFLFERKKGHCEYFASSMAVMLRTLNIPSRVITGFQSGVLNPYTGWQVVRASDAHSWVEAWTSTGGWTVFDPTPSGAPPSDSFLTRAALLYDAADQFWQDWVLRYDLGRQLVLASRMQQSSSQMHLDWLPNPADWSERTWTLLRRAVTILMCAGLLSIAFALYGPLLARWWRSRRGVLRAGRGEGQASDATLLYQRMLAVLEKRGFQKPPWLTPAEFARVLPASETAILVDDLTAAYNQFRFGGQRDAATRMVRLLERLGSQSASDGRGR